MNFRYLRRPSLKRPLTELCQSSQPTLTNRYEATRIMQHGPIESCGQAIIEAIHSSKHPYHSPNKQTINQVPPLGPSSRIPYPCLPPWHNIGQVKYPNHFPKKSWPDFHSRKLTPFWKQIRRQKNFRNKIQTQILAF
jgi:hypothetical protein